MRKIILISILYGFFGITVLVLGLIGYAFYGSVVQFSNSWLALFAVCLFCVIFLLQEELYPVLDHHFKNLNFRVNRQQQKQLLLPEVLKDEQKFQQLISGTVLAWMEKVDIEKEENRFNQGEIQHAIEQYKKARQDSIRWLFLFADHFLLKQSKDVLYEVYERHYITRQTYQEIIDEIDIDQEECEVIIEVLEFLKFIKRQDEEIIITETGSAYCTYLEQMKGQ